MDKKKWIHQQIRNIPLIEEKKLLAEFDYRYVDDRDVNLRTEWIINEYSIREKNEEKFYDDDSKDELYNRLVNWAQPQDIRRSVSLSVTNKIREDFQWRLAGATDRVTQLVDRMEYLSMKYSIPLEPQERFILQAILSDIEVEPVRIENLAKIFTETPFYNNDDAAKSLYLKLKEANYYELLATVESVRR